MCTPLWLWRQRQQCVHDITDRECVRACVFDSGHNTHSHMLTALSARCSQTACHRPRARRILQLWCHHCETELSVFASVSSPSHSHTHIHRCHTAMTSPRTWVQLFYNAFTLIMKPEKHMMIDRLQMAQAIFKLHSGWWRFMRLAKDTQTNSQRQKGRQTYHYADKQT